MSEILIVVLVVICVAQINWSLRRPNGVIEYPFLIAWVYLAWVLPQAYQLLNSKTLPEGALTRLLSMTIVCAVCGFAGYTQMSRHIKAKRSAVNTHRLAEIALAMALAGSYFFVVLHTLPEYVLSESQWSGAPVKFLFLSQSLTVGFYFAVAVYLKTKDHIALPTIGMGLAVYGSSIILSGRRGPTVELILEVLALLWFIRRWRLRNITVICAIPIAVIAVNGIGLYRSTVFAGGRYGVIRDVLDNPIERLSLAISTVAENATVLLVPGEESSEVQNAAIILHSCHATVRFDLGMSLWNDFVACYVPGQFVGYDVKQSLMIDLPPVIDPRLGYWAYTGSTLTGMSDAYASFWFFGGINFFLIGYACRWLWDQSSAGSLAHQVAYAIMMRSALGSLTHSTHHFFNSAIAFLILAGPALYFSRIRTQPQRANADLRPI